MYTVFTPPLALPVTLATAKAHLRVDHDEEDALINLMISGATDYVQNEISGSLITQTIEEVYTHSARSYRLNRPKAIEVVSLYYVPPESNKFDSMYSIDNLMISSGQGSSLILLDAAPVVNTKVADKVRIRYKSGYGNTSEDVPSALRMAILIQLAEMYEHRQVRVRRHNTTVNDLIRDYKYM